jgi:CheY-like chemotaxis protein
LSRIRLRFRQCLLNLAANTCKFTENGTVSIHASIVERDGAPWCDVEVEDTGIGIARESFGQLFEPFVQLEQTATRRYGGTGLGLAISRKYCRLIGGDITVESELGRGSKFRISLPASPQTISRSAEMIERSRYVTSLRERLLVVDDDENNRDMLSRRLARQGYSVEVADSGRDAIEKITAAQYDLVLLDQMMPGMSGLDLLRLLRATFSPSELPVIMVTAVDQRQTLVEALSGGANDM